jgi:hypothetical protein
MGSNTHLQRELVDGRSELTLLQGSELVEQRSCEEPPPNETSKAFSIHHTPTEI